MYCSALKPATLSQKSTFDVVKSERRLAEVIHEREIVQEEVKAPPEKSL